MFPECGQWQSTDQDPMLYKKKRAEHKLQLLSTSWLWMQCDLLPGALALKGLTLPSSWAGESWWMSGDPSKRTECQAENCSEARPPHRVPPREMISGLRGLGCPKDPRTPASPKYSTIQGFSHVHDFSAWKLHYGQCPAEPWDGQRVSQGFAKTTSAPVCAQGGTQSQRFILLMLEDVKLFSLLGLGLT